MTPQNGSFPKRYAKVSRIAEQILHGPRALTFPHDPSGRSSWLEPIMRMTIRSQIPSRTESLGIYCRPNSLDTDTMTPIVLRIVSWDREGDKQLFRRGEVPKPSIIKACIEIDHETECRTDGMLRVLDQSLSQFQFAVEGLAQKSVDSVLHDVPGAQTLNTEAVQLGLFRTTRFQQVELFWTAIQGKLSVFDEAWMKLFEFLGSVAFGTAENKHLDLNEKFPEIIE